MEKENKPSVQNLRRSEKVLSWFIKYIKKCIQNWETKTDPFDTLLLKTHYNFTSHLFLTVFVFATSHWLAEEPIKCVDKHDRSLPPEELLEICLTYPYAEYPYNKDKNKMVRRYALHYKWVHLACLIISFLYKSTLIARVILNKYKNHRKMLENICQAKFAERCKVAEQYFLLYKGCHKGMYWRAWSLHFVALIINILSFCALNVALQNQYWDLPKYLFIKRDPLSFHDPFSLVFPPFANCEITAVHHILVDRTKWFGCYLPLMEIYEKIFMIFWFWQVTLALWTILYILLNLPLSFCFKWKLNLLSNGTFNCFDPFKSCAKKFSTDEIFSLRSVAPLISGGDFVTLLWALLENQRDIQNSTMYYDPIDKMPSQNEQSSFQSCNQENLKIPPPLGFEPFLSPIKPTSNFGLNTEPNLSRISENENAYSTWKRSLSLELSSNHLRRSMGFDRKLNPLMQYLCRDENFCMNISSSFGSNESSDKDHWEEKSNSLNSGGSGKKYISGGEREISQDWESNRDDENWDLVKDDENCESENRWYNEYENWDCDNNEEVDGDRNWQHKNCCSTQNQIEDWACNDENLSNDHHTRANFTPWKISQEFQIITWPSFCENNRRIPAEYTHPNCYYNFDYENWDESESQGKK